jgi:hypothetical protein
VGWCCEERRHEGRKQQGMMGDREAEKGKKVFV